MRSAILLALVLLSCHAVFGQAEGPPIGVEELYLAKDDGSGNAGEQVTEFVTTNVPIYCIVLLDSTDKVTVKMNFVAVSVAGVKADTKVVTASYTTQAGQNRVNFTGRPDGRWTPGRYRVDIFVDGKAARNLEFNIRPASGSPSNGAHSSPLAAPRAKHVRKSLKN